MSFSLTYRRASVWWGRACGVRAMDKVKKEISQTSFMLWALTSLIRRSQSWPEPFGSFSLTLHPICYFICYPLLLNTHLIPVLFLWLQLPIYLIISLLNWKKINSKYSCCFCFGIHSVLFSSLIWILAVHLQRWFAGNAHSIICQQLPSRTASWRSPWASSASGAAQSLQHFLLMKSLIFVLSIWNRRWIYSASVLFSCTFCQSAKVFLSCFVILLLYFYKSVDHSCKIQISSQFSWRQC